MADIPQYPMMFSPDQWSNKFSPFAGKPIPFPAQYRGVPTDAHGNPIQSYLDMQAKHDAWQAPAAAPQAGLGVDPNFALENAWLTANGQPPQLASSQHFGTLGPQTQAALAAQQGGTGTTLNSNPVSNQAVAPAAPVGLQTDLGMSNTAGPQGGSNFNTAMLNSMGRNLQPQQGGGRSSAGEGSIAGPALNNIVTMRGMLQNQGGGQSAAAAATNPYDMNQAYLDALANPGHVTTPGATVPQSAPPSNQSGVMQQFLANWKPGAKGAGNYDNSGFFKALQGQV